MAKTAAVIEVIASSTDIAEVCGGSTVETTSLFILQSGDLRHGLTLDSFDTTSFASTKPDSTRIDTWRLVDNPSNTHVEQVSRGMDGYSCPSFFLRIAQSDFVFAACEAIVLTLHGPYERSTRQELLARLQIAWW